MTASIWNPGSSAPTVFVAVTDLANSTDILKGAGMVGYSDLLEYDPGNVGYKLNAIQDAITILESSGGTGGGGGGGADVIGTPTAFPGLDPSGLADCSGPLQLFFDACKGKKGFLPAGIYRSDVEINIDPAYSYHVEGSGWSANNGTIGTVVKFLTGSDGFRMVYAAATAGPPASNSDTRIRLSRIRIEGPGDYSAAATRTATIESVATTVPVGNGIWAYWVNALDVDDCFIVGFRANGIYGYRCFSSRVLGGFILKNNYSGIHFYNTANAILIDNVKALANGRVRSSASRANILIDAVDGVGPSPSIYQSLGPVVTGNTDVSYGGGNSNVAYSVAAGTLLSIVVGGAGSASVNIPSHGYQVGDKIAIKGGGDPALNSTTAITVATPIGANFFSIATTAAPATYSGPNLAVTPWVAGIATNNTSGMLIDAYSEDCSGSGVYAGGATQGVRVRGGYWQQNLILFDIGATGGEVAGAILHGENAGIRLANEKAAILHGNTYEASATLYVGGVPVVEEGGMVVQGMVIGRGKGNSQTNTSVGLGALVNADQSTSLGNQSAAFGYYALNAMTTGYNNVAMGRHALKNTTTGYQNYAAGNRAAELNITGYNLVAIGHAALSATLSTNNNVGIGTITLGNLTTGDNNFGLGNGAYRYDSTGANLTSLSLSVGIGADVRAGAGATGAINIGASSTTQGNYAIAIGNSAVAAANTTSIGVPGQTTAFKPLGQLQLDVQNTVSTTGTMTADRRIAIQVNGTTYYLLASST